MGKPVEPATLPVDTTRSSAQTAESCCNKSTFRQIVTLILSAQLLVFALLLLLYHGKHGKSGPFPMLEVPIAASFRIQKSSAFIHSHLEQLERNISEEIGFPGEVAVVSIDDIPESNSTEVTIGVPLDGSKNASTDLQMLKDLFVEFFLRQRNISFSSSTFGNISDFQVERFPGGITVIPEPSSLARRGVLFNFTIWDSLSHISSLFKEFEIQLAEGLGLRQDENLITRLTNLNGSTSQPPVIVQISVFHAVGHHLSHHRLRQLAQYVTGQLSENLGLNHTMFGHVQHVELSSFLQHLLKPYIGSPAPAPSPGYHGPYRLRHHHHHHHHRSSYQGISPLSPASHSPYIPPQGSPQSATPLRTRSSGSPWAPSPVYSPSISIPKSDGTLGTMAPSPSAIPSLSAQVPLQDQPSPSQTPTSSSCA